MEADIAVIGASTAQPAKLQAVHAPARLIYAAAGAEAEPASYVAANAASAANDANDASDASDAWMATMPNPASAACSERCEGSQPAVHQSVHHGVAYELDEPLSPEAFDLAARVGDAPMEGFANRPVYRALKRVFDIAFSIVFMVAFSWLYLIIALAVKFDGTGGPVLFVQERVGRDGKLFRMYKFRSMIPDAEARLGELLDQNEKQGPVFKIADDPRITPIGKWIRKLSIDELPQFVNVLKGEMSVVGPRPALPIEVPQYTTRHRARLSVKPGCTCYWQTRRNRDRITFDEWMELDLLYIRQASIWADFKLIVQTLGVILSAQGE